MPVPDFSPGEVLTAAAMDSIGLWKIGSGTLSLTTSVTNVTGVFSSTYRNYRVLLNITARSTTNRFDMRYINGTTPTTSLYYNGGIGGSYASDATIYFQRTSADAQFFFDSQPNLATYTMEIHRPNEAVPTYHMGQTSSSQTAFAYSFGGVNLTSNVHTGFSLVANSGTMTVEYQVFGYRN